MALAFHGCKYFNFLYVLHITIIKKHPRTSNAAYCPVGNQSTVTYVTRLQAIGFDLFSLYWLLCSAKSIVIILNAAVDVNKQVIHFFKTMFILQYQILFLAANRSYAFNLFEKSAIISEILICCGQTASQLRHPIQALGCFSSGTAINAIGAINPPPVKTCSL